MILSTVEPAVPLGSAGLQKTSGVPFGLRGATSLGSGLRSGVVLIDAAGRAAEDLQKVRTALAEAEREAARAEASREFADQVRARNAASAEDSGASDEAGASDPAQRDENALQAVAAAQIAAVRGEPAGRGSFVNFAV